MGMPTITNRVSQIGDVIRGTLIAERLEQIPHLLKAIAERVTLLGGKFYIKNFWADQKHLSLGYVGVHIKIRMPIPPAQPNIARGTQARRRWILMEVQLHAKAIMDGTEGCAKEIAHRLYKAPREVLEEKISPEIISSSQLVYLTSMMKLIASREDLHRVESTVKLVAAATKADIKKHLVLETAMLLHDQSLRHRLGEGDWNERLKVIVPKDKDAVETAWMETASKINRMMNLPVIIMDANEEWTNTATSVQEIYADAAEIAPIFLNMCQQAAASQPGCACNFGPENRPMFKEKKSLLDKMKADQEEELGRYMIQLLHKIGRSWAQITGDDLVPFANFSQLQNLNFYECNQITNNDLSVLRCFLALQNLNLSGCTQITDEGLVHLENLTELRSLNLSGCQITNKGLGHLWRLVGLQILNVYECAEVTEAGLKRSGLYSHQPSRYTPNGASVPSSQPQVADSAQPKQASSPEGSSDDANEELMQTRNRLRKFQFITGAGMFLSGIGLMYVGGKMIVDVQKRL